MPHQYTDEQKEFIKNSIKGIGNKELTEMFNNKFGLNLKVSQIKSYKGNHDLSSGLDGRFKPGSIPPNKGTKGLYNIGGNKTSFKKGNQPMNYRPVGSERVNIDGYIEIKIADPNKWRLKHRVIWEETNGPIPRGHALIFADSDKLNVSLDNLILISRGQLAILNKNKLIKSDAELTKTGIILADIYIKIGERKRKK